jgi:hypothetical protein
MSVDYHIDKELQFVDILASGVLTTAELLQMYETLLEDVDYLNMIPVLTDMTDVHTLDVSLEGIVEVFAVAERRSLGRKNAKSAVVVNDRGQVMFARMSAALADQSSNLPNIAVFATREEALVWLGVGNPRALSA